MPAPGEWVLGFSEEREYVLVRREKLKWFNGDECTEIVTHWLKPSERRRASKKLRQWKSEVFKRYTRGDNQDENQSHR